MAIVDYDFQSDAIGASLPLGPFTNGGALFDQIVAGGPYGTTRCFGLVGNANYTNGSYITSFSQFIAVKKTSTSSVLAFENGPNGLGQVFTLMRVHVEQDGTVTVYDGNATPLKNSVDKLFNFYTWNFFQVNVTLSDAVNVGSGLLCVRITCEIALNGESIMSFALTTTQTVAALANATAQVNIFQMSTSGEITYFDAYTLDTLQPIVTYPHPGTPKAITNQGVIEIELLPDSAKVNTYQGVIEIELLPDSVKARIYQGVIELLLGLGKCVISES